MINFLHSWVVNSSCWHEHPFGNEYHTIWNFEILKGVPIIFCVQLVEGKDQPVQQVPDEFHNCGKPVGLKI